MVLSMSASGDSLLDEASRVLPELRRSLAQVLTCLPIHIRRPRDITRALGVHQTLAWKIMRVVDAKDPLAAAQYIPGTEGLNIFLEAARRRETPPEVIDRVRAAMEGFHRLVAEHAGDRASLELMLGASAREANNQVELACRKGGFQCASFTWGIQARARLMSIMLYPASDPNVIRIGKVAGYIGLRRVRPQIRWMLWHAVYGSFDQGDYKSTLPHRPIDPDGVLPSGVPLLKQYCTVPPSEIERVVLPSGRVEDYWVGGSVGDKAAITCLMGEVVSDAAPRYADEQNEVNSMGMQICTPVEVLIFDLFVHRDLYGELKPELLVYSGLAQQSWYDTAQLEGQEHNLLPFPETVERLGRGPTVIHTADVPRYEEMMRFAFANLDWDIEACDVYRLRMVYPVVATVAIVTFPLPPAPQPAE